MVGAGLFLRTLVNLNNIDPGFNRENVLRLNIDSQSTGMKGDDPRLRAMFQQIESRVSNLPGVKAASFSAFTFNEGSWNDLLFVPGMPVNENISVHQNVVGNGYFDTMQIPLLAGRTFSSADTSISQHVAVISEHIAKALFPPGNPIGSHFTIGEDKPENEFEVIGIVKDVKFGALQERPKYINYLSYLQSPWNYGDFEVRYSGDFNAASNSVQQAIHSINRTVPITQVTTLDEQVNRSTTNQRMVAQLSVFFGLVAVFLSWHWNLWTDVLCGQPSHERYRHSHGAGRSAIQCALAGHARNRAAGCYRIAIGIPFTLFGSSLVANMLYGLKGTDPVSLAASVALLLAVAIFAGYFPAQRASRVDPMIALRYE